MHSTRRDFLGSFGLLGAAILVSRGLAACSVSGSAAEEVGQSDDALVTCGPAIIGTNHGHALVVPAEDVAAGVEKTYSIKGTSTHDHKVTITPALFVQLGRAGAITVTSTAAGGHTHNVTVSCARVPEGDAGASTDASAEPKECNGATASLISANHGHTLTVSRDDVEAGETKIYSIKGTSTHPHDVTITASQFAEIRTGGSVSVVSTTVGGHAHTVTVVCG
jgi:hypothetical protein